MPACNKSPKNNFNCAPTLEYQAADDRHNIQLCQSHQTWRRLVVMLFVNARRKCITTQFFKCHLHQAKETPHINTLILPWWFLDFVISFTINQLNNVYWKLRILQVIKYFSYKKIYTYISCLQWKFEMIKDLLPLWRWTNAWNCKKAMIISLIDNFPRYSNLKE